MLAPRRRQQVCYKESRVRQEAEQEAEQELDVAGSDYDPSDSDAEAHPTPVLHSTFNLKLCQSYGSEAV